MFKICAKVVLAPEMSNHGNPLALPKTTYYDRPGNDYQQY